MNYQLNKDVVNAIAALAVTRQQSAVNWIDSDGQRRWKIGHQSEATLTDEEAVCYLLRPHVDAGFRVFRRRKSADYSSSTALA